MATYFAPPHSTTTRALPSTPPPNAELTLDDLVAVVMELRELVQELSANLVAENEERVQSGQAHLDAISHSQVGG